jgi:MoaA/NifB/PqqE/SkfB family radical SAM enzyme
MGGAWKFNLCLTIQSRAENLDFTVNSTSCEEPPIEPLRPIGATPIERFVWDMTYACPLRCLHCYSESGRRASRTLTREDGLRVIDVMISQKPQKVSFSGGEPLLVPWWGEAARRLKANGIPVVLHASGWLMDEQIANELAESVAVVAVSVDGATAETHDTVRGRQGSFRKAMDALEILARVKGERESRGESCYELSVDFTVTRTARHETTQFVKDMTSRFKTLSYVRLGGVIPCGLGEEEGFEQELLTESELSDLAESAPRLIALSKHGIRVDVTDVRLFRPDSPLSKAGDSHAHLEPDGQLRAFATYEAKVGSVLEVPIDELWARALAWRNDPFVLEQRSSIHSSTDWARVARVLDRRFGSKDDLVRIAKRGGRAAHDEQQEAALR